MKKITLKSTNQRGEEKQFTISATHNKGNFYALKIESDFDIAEAVNGHAAINESGTMRNYTLENFKLKGNAVSQIIVTPKDGSKKDRFTLQLNNNDLR